MTSPSSDPVREPIERLLKTAEARLPGDEAKEEVGPVRIGLIAARFVADRCREALAELDAERP